MDSLKGVYCVKLKVKPKRNPQQDKAQSELEESVPVYATLQEQEQMLKKHKSEYRDAILERVKLIGNRDADGQLIASTPTHIVTCQHRVSKVLDEDKAREILARKGLLDEVEKTEIYLDENEISRLFEQGRITPKELDHMLVISQETDALYVTAKNKTS